MCTEANLRAYFIGHPGFHSERIRFFLCSRWSPHRLPQNVYYECKEHTHRVPHLAPDRVPEASAVTPGPSEGRHEIIEVGIGDQGISTLQDHLDDKWNYDGEPLPGVEVHAHEVQAPAEAELCHVALGGPPAAHRLSVVGVLRIGAHAPLPHLWKLCHF